MLAGARRILSIVRQEVQEGKDVIGRNGTNIFVRHCLEFDFLDGCIFWYLPAQSGVKAEEKENVYDIGVDRAPGFIADGNSMFDVPIKKGRTVSVSEWFVFVWIDIGVQCVHPLLQMSAHWPQCEVNDPLFFWLKEVRYFPKYQLVQRDVVLNDDFVWCIERSIAKGIYRGT